MKSRGIGGIVVLATLALSLGGCTAAPVEPVAGSSISVGTALPFFSLNDATAFGSTAGNSEIVAATSASFSYYDSTPKLVTDESFGTVTKLSDDPLVVRYTVADGVRWSDGTAVDASDLLLNWAATSGALNDDFDRTALLDQKTGEFTGHLPTGTVFFDSGSDPEHPRGIGLVSTVPDVSEDLKSITMQYDAPYVDWQSAFPSAGRPAHVVGAHALGITDAQQAKDAVIEAITDDDAGRLSAISDTWNTAFTFDGMPSKADADLLVSNGPYVITDMVADQFVTLTANPEYSGSRRPTIEKVVIRTISDPLAAVQALSTGAVQVITPSPTAEVVDVLQKVDTTIISGSSGAYEHLDLQFAESKNGTFENPLVREAFLKTVPRQAIVDEVVAGVQEEARTRDSFLFLPATDGYAETVKSNGSDAYAEVDIEGAKALLAEAGAVAPEVCILYAPDDPRRMREFQLISDSATLAGFTVTDCSDPAWRKLLGSPGRYDAALFSWRQAGVGVASAAAFYGTNGIDNLNYYSNAKVDSILTHLSSSFDADAQLDLQLKLDAALWTDGYGLPLYQQPLLVAYDQASVEGVAPSPIGPTVLWNLWQWKPVEP
jgi:peptide/nickel transport system substrate-binding protein